MAEQRIVSEIVTTYFYGLGKKISRKMVTENDVIYTEKYYFMGIEIKGISSTREMGLADRIKRAWGAVE